jgi:hypothetical protein
VKINVTLRAFVAFLLCTGGCVQRSSEAPQPAPRQGYGPSTSMPGRPAVGLGRVQVPLLQTPSAMVARVIRADSPQGLGPQHLGMPLDANFNPMMGAGAGTLFPQAGAPIVMTVNEMRHDQELVTTTEQLNASAHYLVYNGDVGAAQTKRFGIYRAVELAEVIELRDNTPMNPPPAGAVYYPWRIYRGHAYTEVFEGDSTTFNADVGAKFLTWGGSIGVFKSTYKVQSTVKGRGLSPVNGQSIFAHDPQEITRAYSADGPAVPIIVEYRQIPNTRTKDGTIVWVQPPPSKTIQVRFTNLQVAAEGAALRSYATWNMAFQCFINGQASGAAQPLQENVSVGNYPLAFMQQLTVNDSDTIECLASGQYLRAGDWQALGRSTTGPIVAGRLTSATSVMQGRDAKTSYAITWSATRL